MRTISTRIARLAAVSALTLIVGATAGTGSALASYSSCAGSAPIDTVAADEDAGTDGLGKPGGIHAVEDGAGTDGDDAPSFTWSSADDATPNGQIASI